MSMTGIQLLSPTNRTVEGPWLQQEGDRLIVEYDYQADDGSIEWRKIVFGDILAVEYRQVSCCDDNSVIGAREIRSSAQSPRLAEVVKRWNESVGWQDWHQKQGGASRFKHYTIFFDEAGCVDVIAASCELT
jgi:hypothetical protein